MTSAADTLHLASSTGDLDALRRLLDGGADVNARDDDGYSALDLAMMVDDRTALDLLLSSGADPNACGFGASDCPPLHAAALWGRPHVISMLLEFGADPDRRMSSHEHYLEGRTPLMQVCSGRGKLHESVELLLAAGASPEAADGHGRTALHHLAMSVTLRAAPELERGTVADMAECLKTAQLLLAAGVDAADRDEFGMTATMHAARTGDAGLELLRLFERHGAVLTTEDRTNLLADLENGGAFFE